MALSFGGNFYNEFQKFENIQVEAIRIRASHYQKSAHVEVVICVGFFVAFQPERFCFGLFRVFS